METIEGWLEALKQFENGVLLAINGWHSPLADQIMWLLTGKLIWFPFYAYLLYLVYKKLTPKEFLLFLVVGLATVGFADMFANYGLKHTIQRYRPSHNLELGPLLRFYEFKPGELYRGGQYGFVSGHSTNSFAIAWFFGLFLKKYYRFAIVGLMLWALVIVYTRLYLGVHYPSDIIGGFIVGTSFAFAGNFFYKKLKMKFFNKPVQDKYHL